LHQSAFPAFALKSKRNHNEGQTKMLGVVRRFYSERHYGFLVSTVGELFFHEIDVVELPPGGITKGTKVDFNVGEYKGRQKAIDIRVIVPTDGVFS
jgi:cold shock CspA family protein